MAINEAIENQALLASEHLEGNLHTMQPTLGNGVIEEEATEWVWRLTRLLPEGEGLRFIGGAEAQAGHDLTVITSERVLVISIRRGYEILDEFSLSNVRTVYTGDDNGDRIVHVPLKDGGHWILRPRQMVDEAELLGREIGAAVRAKNLRSRPGPLMPNENESDGPSIFEQGGMDYLMLVVTRQEVEIGDTTPTLNVLANLLETRAAARSFRECVALSFSGYEDTTAELFEIAEVRDYIQELDSRFPYWLFFLDKRTSSFDALWRSFMPPFLTDSAKRTEFPTLLGDLLRNWWVPAMNQMCEYVDMSPAQQNELTDRFRSYLQGNRQF